MGQFDGQELATAICAGFNERPKDICTREHIRDFLSNRDEWEIPEYGNTIFGDILFWGCIICVINIGIMAYCKMKKEDKDRGMI